MTRSVVILLSALLLPQFASAKRLAPGNVESVVYGGIRYVAPNNDGRLGYVEGVECRDQPETVGVDNLY
jgi:hypothetical protein